MFCPIFVKKSHFGYPFSRVNALLIFIDYKTGDNAVTRKYKGCNPNPTNFHRLSMIVFLKFSCQDALFKYPKDYKLSDIVWTKTKALSKAYRGTWFVVWQMTRGQVKFMWGRMTWGKSFLVRANDWGKYQKFSGIKRMIIYSDSTRRGETPLKEW